jgi:hypothetical protein
VDIGVYGYTYISLSYTDICIRSAALLEG